MYIFPHTANVEIYIFQKITSEFSLNSIHSATKNSAIKGIQLRDICQHLTTQPQNHRYNVFKLTIIHASVIYQIC